MKFFIITQLLLCFVCGSAANKRKERKKVSEEHGRVNIG
jgi:hypothetical protein